MNYYIQYIKNLSLFSKYLYFAIFLHIISAYFSIGFYKDDEHFQILEPLANLLGLNNYIMNPQNVGDAKGHYWEWGHRMRPWLQPYIYYYIVIFLKLLGLHNPFIWSFIIKIFTSTIGLLSITYLFLSFRKIFFKSDNHFNYFLFFSFWFYPFLHSRTSSENLSISLFIIGFCFLYNCFINNYSKSDFFKIFIFSFILGLSLVVRLNLIFTIIPIFFWVLFYTPKYTKIFIVIIGVIVALCFGLFIDFVNYGNFSNTYWNFFYHNIVLGRMAAFGEQPFWYYLPAIAIQLAPVLSIFFVISLIIFWIKNPSNVFTWITFFTLIIISFFSHKEIRYAFPLYIFAPFFISYFFETYNLKFKNFFKFIILLSNFLFLVFTLFTPANGKVGVYNFLYQENITENNVYYIDRNPYLINNMEPLFYLSFLPQIQEIKKEDEYSKNVIAKKWITTNNYQEYKKVLKNKNCIKKYNSFPEKIILLNRNWTRQKFNWYIVYCD